MSPDARAWEALVREARSSAKTPAADAGALLTAAKAVTGRVIPASQHRDQCAFEALRAVGRAYAAASSGRRVRLGAALGAVAEECAHALGWTLPELARREPRSWRSRADCGEGA